MLLKLSKLQKWILRAALHLLIYDEEREGIFYSDVKEGYFLLPRSHFDGSGWVFSKTTASGYMKASNSVSRSAKRLKERGLVTIERALQDAEIRPTTKGYAIAAAIEAREPGAFGFVPITRRRLNSIAKESTRLSPKERFVESILGRIK